MDQMELFRSIVKANFQPPSKMSEDAKSIIGDLLTRNPEQRLGSLADGENGILEHPFFESIDFDELRQKTIKPPRLPKIKDPLDASNFDDWSHLGDKSKENFPRLTRDQQSVFESF